MQNGMAFVLPVEAALAGSGSGSVLPSRVKWAQRRRPLPLLTLVRAAITLASVSFGLPALGTAQDTWTTTSTVDAPSARLVHTAVWTGSTMIVWGGRSSLTSGDVNTGGVYDPATDMWTATSTVDAPTARSGATGVWTDSQMIVWGGYVGVGLTRFNTGGIYDLATDTWTATSTAGAPSARDGHTAVWTGSQVIAWGGASGPGVTPVKTGGIYDPATDTWTPTSTVGAPSARYSHTAVWTGSKMIVWGGYDFNFPNTGGIYDPASDMWTATSTVGAPSGRSSHTAVWTGSQMIVWGGGAAGFRNTGAVYDPTTDTWTATSTVAAPSAREYHTAVWTGSSMIIWGGRNCFASGCELKTGGVYDPVTDRWAATTTVGAPSGRYYHPAVWTDSRMITWGGYNHSVSLNTGGMYEPVKAGLAFSAGTYTVSEIGRAATVTVTRTGDEASWVSVDFLTRDGTATAGLDYVAALGTLGFAAGQLSRTFRIRILDDALGETDETVNLALSNPTGGATLGVPSTALLTIRDNDVAGAVQFSLAAYSVNESDGTATIAVTRTRAISRSAVTVDFATGDGTATADSDYTPTSGTLSFAPGQIGTSFTVPILEDGLIEGNETVYLTLSNQTGGARLGPRSTAVLTIVDNE